MLTGAPMEKVRRVLVHLSKENCWPRPARFQQSIVGNFCAASKDSLMVNCGLNQHQFLISDTEFAGSRQVLLQRPPFCPIKHLSDAQAASLPAETRDRGVDVAVAVLLQAACRKVLLTRRSKHLSIFPNLWVPPGGHIEPGEQSVYPPMLSRGMPKRHHVVVYLLLLSPESYEQLQVRFKPDEAEVSAYTWLEPQVLASVAATEDGARDAKKVADDLPPVVRITELQHGSAKTTAVPTATFLNTAPPQGEDVERVSTGTKFALRLWLSTLAPQTE
ncbi:m7GpppN-mRNA hydrolase NUDT17 isoform X2 [Paroedura picta]|uniref:m7GpppN-mRNA hydrolase NUDT17 isoform X2 n=1 Tax=Paroedura picta TaxID=143630 RepID=UPI004056B924